MHSKFISLHLGFFQQTVWSHSIPTNLIGLLNPKNIGADIDILLISHLEAKICVFEVNRPPSWIFPHPVCSHSILSGLIGLSDPKNIGVAVGILFIRCQEAEKCVFEALQGVFQFLK